MFCTKCGKEIPDGSAFCSACGAPVVTDEAKTEGVAEVTQDVAKTEGVAEVAQDVAKTEGVIEVAQEVAKTESFVEASGFSSESEKKKKKGKGGVIIGVLLGVVAVLAISVGAAFLFARDKVENFIHVRFDKPVEYYSYVINRNYRSEKEVIPVSVYSKKVKEQMNIFNSAGYEKFQLKLGQRGKDFLKLTNGLGVDLDWIDSVGLDFRSDVQMKNKAASASAVAYLNGEKIISGNLLVDLAKGELAMQSPELSEKFVKYVFSDSMNLEELEKSLTKMQDMMSMYPDAEFYQKKLNYYLDQYLAMVDEVEKSTDSITADEMTKECTALAVTMNQEKIQKFAKIVMEDLASDPEIEGMVRKIAENSNQDADEAYADFKKQCEDAVTQEKLDEIALSKIKLVIYVDKDSKVLGVSLKIEGKATKEDEETREVKFEAYSLQEDNKRAQVFRCVSKESTVVFQGSGMVKDGKLNGDYVLNVDDKQMMKLGVDDFDLEAMKKGDMVGHFVVKQGKDFNFVDGARALLYGTAYRKSEMANDAADNTIMGVLDSLDLSLDIVVNLQGNVCKEELGIQDGGVDIVRLILETGMEEQSVIKLPDDAIDLDENMEEYLRDLKLGTVIEALKNANVPEKYYGVLKDYEKQLEDYLEYYGVIYNR